MRRIAPEWLTAPATRRVLDALTPARPLFVGGCVRDALMGRETADVDISVTTSPEESLRLAEAAGLGAHRTGVAHGVVTLTADGAPFEVATLRRDVATDGRRAVVAFTTRIEEDAARRDFTMNALYADAEGVVIDPLATGLADLDAGRIRFIGDAAARIREDYLRILRFFRFHAQFGVDDFDAAGLNACHELAAGLRRISRERIGSEMLKLLAAPDPEPALAAMGPVLGQAAPGARVFSGLVAAEIAMGVDPDPLRRLAALGADDAAASLRLSNGQAKRLAAIAAAREAPLAEAAYRHGAAATTDALALTAADGISPPGDWRESVLRAAAAQLPIAANDLMAEGAAPGPALGETLRALEAAWIASGFTLTRAALLDQAKELRG